MPERTTSLSDEILKTPNDFELAIFNEYNKLKVENEKLKKRGEKNENININEEFRNEKLRYFMKNSYFHGFLDISSNSGVLPAYGCYSVLDDFMQSPVVISYMVLAMKNSWILPDIVICPFNRFNRSYLLELNVSANLAQYLELTYPSPIFYDFQLDAYNKILNELDENQAELDELLKKIGNLSFTEFIKESAIDCSAFFVDNKTCENVTEVMTSLGSCFRIPGKNQSIDGFGHGQRFTIKLPKELYQAGVTQQPIDGIAVKLVAPGRGIDQDLSFVPPSVHAIMPLKATKFEFKNDPPRYRCNKRLDKTYSQNECYSACLMEPAELSCNCSLAISTHSINKEICNTKQYIQCFFKKFYIDQTERAEICKNQCLPRCKYWQFDKTVTYAKFPSKEVKAFVSNPDEYNKLKNQIILEIYYESMYYTLIKHYRVFTASNFVAQIGGQLGLWLGGSIISIIQFFVYLILTGYILFMGRLKQKIHPVDINNM